MPLTDKQIKDLNKMNKSAQNVALGSIIETIVNTIENGGGTIIPPNPENPDVPVTPTEGDGGVIQKSTHLQFPNIGDEKNLYIDTSKNISYRWDNSSRKYYMVGFDPSKLKRISAGDSRG